MKPSQLARSLRIIAAKIENSKNPRRDLVVADLKRVMAISLNDVNFDKHMDKLCESLTIKQIWDWDGLDAIRKVMQSKIDNFNRDMSNGRYGEIANPDTNPELWKAHPLVLNDIKIDESTLDGYMIVSGAGENNKRIEFNAGMDEWPAEVINEQLDWA